MARENRGGVWDLDKLMTTLLAEVEAQEASESTKVTTSKPPYPSASHSHSTASSLVAGVQPIQCVYCRGSHYSASCSVVKNIRERKELLTRLGCCFNCLKTNHRAKDCDRTHNCRNCNRRHHQSLCDQPLRNTSASNATTSTNVTVSKSDTSANDTLVPVTTTSVANAATSKRIVLLQTARAVATNESGTALKNVRLLFDNGSQRSYITD